MFLISELRNNPHSDIQQILNTLYNMKLQFSPLLEWILHELCDNCDVPDIENVPILNMQDGSTVSLPALNPWVTEFFSNPENAVDDQYRVNLISTLE